MTVFIRNGGPLMHRFLLAAGYLAASSVFLAPSQCQAADQPEWTVMVFMNAKNNLEPYAYHNFVEMASVGSTENVNILVELGRPNRHYSSRFPEDWSKTLRFRITKDQKPTQANAVQDLGKVDMGSGNVLMEFVRWSQSTYPAKHYMLIVWDHGQGWRYYSALTHEKGPLYESALALRKEIWAKAGFKGSGSPKDAIAIDESIHGTVRWLSQDEDTGNKLYNRDMQDALRLYLGNARLDVIAFDACLMSMIETAFAMREVGKVMVASQELEPARGWNYSIWLKALTADPSIDGPAVGKSVVDAYRDRYKETDDTTMAALDLAQVENLASKVSAVAGILNRSLEDNNLLPHIKKARSDSLTYAPDYGLQYVDIGMFLDNIVAECSDKADIVSQAKDARKQIGAMVLQNYVNDTRKAKYGSNGVSIYFPSSKTAFELDPDHDGYEISTTHFPVEFVTKKLSQNSPCLNLGILAK